jgi:hypothetical protein
VFEEQVFHEVNESVICPSIPDPMMMLVIGCLVGFFIGSQLLLVAIKLYGNPFSKKEEPDMVDELLIGDMDDIDEDAVK